MPVCNTVLAPDLFRMAEDDMDDKRWRIIGIDVGKRSLDVAREGVARIERHANTGEAIAALVEGLDRARDIAVFERSGGYERGLEAALSAAGIGWSVVPPLRVKAFRTAEGIKAKTDAIDARLLMRFGRSRLVAGDLRLGRAEDVELAALMARRRQLAGALHAERCRQETAVVEVVRASLARTVERLESELAAIEAAITAKEASEPQLKAKEAVLCAQIGIARSTARSLLAAVPELGRLDGKQVTALSGLAPRVHQSGSIRQRRGLAPGRSAVKAALFYPALSAMRFDPVIASFAQRLKQRGKPGKVIMVAVMRKLLVRLNAALRDALAIDPSTNAAPAAV